MLSLKKVLTLKTRIFICFFGILILIAGIYIFSIHKFITNFTENRLNSDYETIISDIHDSIANSLWNLTLTSEQILGNENVQKSIVSYQSTPNRYAQKENYSLLVDTIASLTMSNTDIGLLFLYDTGNGAFIYNNLPVPSEPEITFPALYENNIFCFRGPCKSQSQFLGNPVLILNRTEQLSNGSSITLSLETGLYTLSRSFDSAASKSAYILFANSENELLYSSLPEKQDSAALIGQFLNGSCKDYHYWAKENPQGWQVFLAVPNTVYTQDYQMAMSSFLFPTILVGIFVGFFALYVWKSIFKPLRLFDRQLASVLSGNENTEQFHSAIPEYENLLEKIALLRHQIQEMIQQIITQEKLRAQIELEKLRAQINPHFLMNTLNTIHWMALINHQTDIDQMTQALSHLLSYNLDKQSHFTNLGNELMALQEYITLQKVRYNFDFEVNSPVPLPSLNYPCPKFILQPLVENALSHGYRENMSIFLKIQVTEEEIQVNICDTGTGISPDTLKELQSLTPAPTALCPAPDKTVQPGNTHFGIGLRYVVQSLNEFYRGTYNFTIESTQEQGTTITLKIPKMKGGGYYAESVDYR